MFGWLFLHPYLFMQILVFAVVLIFQAKKNVTIEILAERRTKCRVRRHGTTGRRSLRSYRAVVPHVEKRPEGCKINRRFNDHRLDRERFRGSVDEPRYDRTKGSAVVPCGRTAPARSVQNSRNFTEGLTIIGIDRRRSRATVPCDRTMTPGRIHVDSTRYERNHPSAIVPCDRTVSATTSSTARSQV